MSTREPHIRTTRHARNRMRLYGVSLQEVRRVLEEPSDVRDSIKGRHNAYGVVEGRLLRVTYIEEAQGFVVVTVTSDVSTLEV